MPWAPGQSGNPRGRPPGAAGLAATIKKKFGNDLEKLVDHVEAALADPACSYQTKLGYVQWLTDRAVGRVPERLEQTIDVEGSIEMRSELKMLTDDELDAMKCILKGAVSRSRPAQALEDAELVEPEPALLTAGLA